MLIVLSFANQTDSHLNLLNEESSEIRNALRPLEKRGFVAVEHEESTTVKELAEMFLDNPDQLTIFHYGGHAGSDEILLEDAEASEKGLAQLLGQQKNLKLVFLNGCSTKGQVDTLFAAGVKAVIATSASINDNKAKDFAISFYKALAYKQTIKQAFYAAKGVIELRKDAPEIGFRKIGRINEPSLKTAETMLWGLYIQPQYEEEILNFRLPYYRMMAVSQDVLANVKANRHITSVLEEMCRYKKDIYTEMVTVRSGEDVKRDSSYYLKLVFENFPLPIGKQIQLLKPMEVANLERLEQLISTYIVTGQTLYFILLSNFWEEVSKNNLTISPNFLSEHQLTFENEKDFDFFKAILDLYEYIKKLQMPLFAPEYEILCKNLLDDNQDAHNAHQYLQILRGGYAKTPKNEIAETCENVEMALKDILWEAAFLVGYDFFSVRDIEIRFPRSSTISYELDWGMVDTNITLFNDNENRRRPVFTNCDSIVMLAYGRDGDLSHYLNLSPFIIDKNTFHKTVIDDNTVQKNRLIDLFMFRYEKNGIFHFATINHNYFVAARNEKGTDIVHTKMTLRDFEKGENIKSTLPAYKSSKAATVKTPEIIKDLSEINPIFADLELQFLNFKNAFTPRETKTLTT
jgi:CHAT domain